MMEITGRTELLAILAEPVAQARAPGLVNAALASRGCDAVLVPLRVPSEALERVVAALRAIGNFKGAVVSMPHKSRTLSLVDEATPQAREVGACNVIRREADGRRGRPTAARRAHARPRRRCRGDRHLQRGDAVSRGGTRAWLWRPLRQADA
jgi:shikimate 5-dehydrogenase